MNQRVVNKYYAPCFACCALFGSLVPAMCNCMSCVQVHELLQSHCGDNQEGTLFSWLHIYYAHLAFVRFEHSVCCGSLMTTCVYIYIYIYINLKILKPFNNVLDKQNSFKNTLFTQKLCQYYENLKKHQTKINTTISTN